MDIKKFASKSAQVGEIYPLEHFRTGWHAPVRRLMGNELVFPPSPKVIKAVQDAASTLNWYPEDILTDVELRSKLAEYVGLPGKADWITAGNGSMEVIDLLYETFLDEGDEIILPTPDYSPYARRTKLYGAKVVEAMPIDDEFNYNLESFTSKVTPKTKMIYLSRPNNPDGHFVSRELIEGLCKTGVIVSVDEAYYEFGTDPVEDLLLKYDNMLISHTFSKAMGLAGIRLGWIVSNPQIIELINKVRQPANINQIAHVAAIAAIDDAEYIRENVRKVKENRAIFFNEIQKVKGMRPIPSEANFVMVDCLESGFKASDIQKYLFNNGYLVRNFVNGKGLPGDRFYRVSMGTREDTLKVLELIKEFCK